MTIDPSKFTINARYKLAGTHPWAGFTGVLTGFETVGGRPAALIQLDDADGVPEGHRCYAFNDYELRKV